MTGQSDEDIKAELFMFYYCISYMKKDKNGKCVITDFSQIVVSDLTVVKIKREINNKCDDNSLYISIYFYFLGDCRSEEEHEEIMQKVLAKARERRLNAYKSIRYL